MPTGSSVIWTLRKKATWKGFWPNCGQQSQLRKIQRGEVQLTFQQLTTNSEGDLSNRREDPQRVLKSHPVVGYAALYSIPEHTNIWIKRVRMCTPNIKCICNTMCKNNRKHFFTRLQKICLSSVLWPGSTRLKNT